MIQFSSFSWSVHISHFPPGLDSIGSINGFYSSSPISIISNISYHVLQHQRQITSAWLSLIYTQSFHSVIRFCWDRWDRIALPVVSLHLSRSTGSAQPSSAIAIAIRRTVILLSWFECTITTIPVPATPERQPSPIQPASLSNFSNPNVKVITIWTPISLDPINDIFEIGNIQMSNGTISISM